MPPIEKKVVKGVDCLFCKIAEGNLPAKIVYRGEHVIGFDDINPQAPIHKVFIPIKHLSTFNDVQQEDVPLLAELTQAAILLAKTMDIAEPGYRIIMNCNQDGGQSVFHIHLHLLGGRKMHWPPG